MSSKDKTIHIQSSHYSQIPISDNTSEYKRVIQFLEEKDYDIAYYLKDLKDDERLILQKMIDDTDAILKEKK